MKNKSNLRVVHRPENISVYAPEEIYLKLSEVKEDLQEIISLLDQQLDLGTSQNKRGDTGKTSIASFC